MLHYRLIILQFINYKLAKMKNKISFFSCIAALLIFTSCNNSSTPKDVVATTTDSTATASIDNTADWKIGVQLWTFRLFTQSEAIAKADSAGVRYIEAFLGQPFDKTSKDTFGIRMSAAGRQKLKDVLKLHNIQMVAMGVTTPNGKDEWIKTFELAKEFGLNEDWGWRTVVPNSPNVSMHAQPP